MASTPSNVARIPVSSSTSLAAAVWRSSPVCTRPTTGQDRLAGHTHGHCALCCVVDTMWKVFVEAVADSSAPTGQDLAVSEEQTPTIKLCTSVSISVSLSQASLWFLSHGSNKSAKPTRSASISLCAHPPDQRRNKPSRKASMQRAHVHSIPHKSIRIVRFHYEY